MGTAILDPWALAPAPEDKLSNCGKYTRVTEFDNDTVWVQIFYCHRWDCLTCQSMKLNELNMKLLKKQPIYYGITISEDRYAATMKTINRRGAKRCCVGVGDEILVLMTKDVLPNTRPLFGSRLTDAVTRALECEYQPHKRRIRTSRGFFPVPPKPDPKVHFARKVVVNKTAGEVIDNLEWHGYIRNTYVGNIYMRPFSPDATLEHALKPPMIAWCE